MLTGDRTEAEIEQNFQFDTDIRIKFDGTTAIATAPNGARLLLLPLTGGLEPVLTIGDKAPHVTYWPAGIATDDWHPSEACQAITHGRGWMGRGGHKLMPAPAVTYVGKVELPGALTVALIPLEPGQSMDRMPKISSEAADRETRWSLPTGGGRLSFAASVDGCRIAE